MYTLYIWLYMAICSNIYMFLTIYLHCINIYGSFGLYTIASCSYIGLCWLDLALRAKIQACICIYIYIYIYIYIGSALHASLYIGLYTCIWAIYAQSIHIYGCHIYIYGFYLAVLVHCFFFIYHFGTLPGVIIYHKLQSYCSFVITRCSSVKSSLPFYP